MKTANEIFVKGVSPSMLKLWLLCRRRWYNDYVLDLRKVDSVGVEAIFGGAWDKVMNYYYTEVKPDLLTALELFYQVFPKNLDCDKRSQGLGEKLIKKYFEFYPRESESIIIKEVQKEWIVPYKDILIHCVTDNIIEYNGKLAVMDNKTTSRMDEVFRSQFRNDFQVYAYLYVTGATTFLLNGVGCKKTVDRDSFLRNDYSFVPDQISFHVEQFYLIAKEMIEFVHKNVDNPASFAMNASRNSCFAFMRECPYLTSCEFNGKL